MHSWSTLGLLSALTVFLLVCKVVSNYESSNIGRSPENSGSSTANIVCFYSLSEELPPEAINATYCNYLITSGNIVNYTLTGNVEDLARITALKQINPNLKVLLCAADGGALCPLSQIVHSEELSQRFIASAISFLADNGLDGLDIDWEFPAWSGDPADSKEKFPIFLQKFREAAEAYANETQTERLILSVDVAAPLTIIEISYDVPELNKYVDFVNIMCYDYHFYTWYDITTGHNSPLFNRSNEQFYFATENLAWSANFWVFRGMDKSKINVGIPTYGHTYTLYDPSDHGFHALATGPGSSGDFISFPSSCRFLQNNGTEVFDEESQVPYAYQNYDWIAYDDVQSITAKAQWIVENQFAGIMVFNYNNDDAEAVCDGSTRFPLISAIYATINAASGPRHGRGLEKRQ